mmetsp:Transcript_30982/g.49703  ORF Transcript_30982/g.49703 Transcript_30982/m.49703 type:complete len:148 (-) Transcript_30982:216-659(-)
MEPDGRELRIAGTLDRGPPGDRDLAPSPLGNVLEAEVMECFRRLLSAGEIGLELDRDSLRVMEGEAPLEREEFRERWDEKDPVRGMPVGLEIFEIPDFGIPEGLEIAVGFANPDGFASPEGLGRPDFMVFRDLMASGLRKAPNLGRA